MAEVGKNSKKQDKIKSAFRDIPFHRINQTVQLLSFGWDYPNLELNKLYATGKHKNPNVENHCDIPVRLQL